MNQLWNSGAFETGIYTMDSASSKAAIQNGNCAISIGTYANTSSFADGVAHIEVMEPLVSKYQGTKQWRKNPVVNFRACVANANCEDLDTLLAFLDSFYAPHDNPLNKEGTVYGASLSKGVTGVNIAIDHEAKTWTSLEKFSNYSDNLYTGIIGEYVPISSLHVKGKGTMENLLPYAKEVSNLTALVVLSEDDQDNYADLWTDLEKYISQMHGMVNDELMSLLTPDCLIVNTSRGSLIDEAAMAKHLQQGHFRAILDVYEEEPLSVDSPLRGLENVILMPHRGGPTTDRRAAATRIVIDDVINIMEGRPAKNELAQSRAATMTHK